MSKRIKIINTSGQRLPKKPNPNQSDLKAFGYDTVSGTYYSLPIEIGIDNNQIVPTNIGTQSDALNILTNSVSTDGSNHGFLTETLIGNGGKTIIQIGAVWNTVGNPTLSDNVVVYEDIVIPGVPFIVQLGEPGTPLNEGETTYVSAFVIANGITAGQSIEEVVYGGQLNFVPRFCLIEGTLITLFDFTHKKIEDITYEDDLLVWNFDEGKFDKSKPLWIAQSTIAYEYCLTKFSDGSELGAILPHLGHRILNINKGTFTYTMNDDAVINETITFKENGENITLISKEIVKETAKFYNIITDKHLNMFANGILTSCRLNNIYPIADMKFIKHEKELKKIEEFENISDIVFDGLRLAEQDFSVEDLKKYISTRNIK